MVGCKALTPIVPAAPPPTRGQLVGHSLVDLQIPLVDPQLLGSAGGGSQWEGVLLPWCWLCPLVPWIVGEETLGRQGRPRTGPGRQTVVQAVDGHLPHRIPGVGGWLPSPHPPTSTPPPSTPLVVDSDSAALGLWFVVPCGPTVDLTLVVPCVCPLVVDTVAVALLEELLPPPPPLVQTPDSWAVAVQPPLPCTAI